MGVTNHLLILQVWVFPKIGVFPPNHGTYGGPPVGYVVPSNHRVNTLIWFLKIFRTEVTIKALLLDVTGFHLRVGEVPLVFGKVRGEENPGGS